MLANRKTAFLGHADLSLFDFGVVKLFDASALYAHEVIVVAVLVQLEHRFAGLEMMALEDAGLLELGEDPVHGGKTHVQSLVHEDPVDILRRKVAHLAALEKLENAQPRTRRLQAYGLQVVDVGHDRISAHRGCLRSRKAEAGRRRCHGRRSSGKDRAMKLAVAGAAGRMGRTLIEMILRSGDLKLAAALEAPGSPAIGRDAGELVGNPCGVKVVSDPANAVAGADCLIDFTRPEGTLAHVEQCVKKGVRMVIGTTGFSAQQNERIAEAAAKIAIVLAPNMSAGVNVAFKLAETAARALGDGYDVEIIEAHHRHKVDAPPGTAPTFGDLMPRSPRRDAT